MIALVDGNNFFVSCERVLNPVINNKPVIVLSNNDGCVISRSNEAKSLGIQMGEPLFKIRGLVEKHKVLIYSVNFDLYQHFSTNIANALREFSLKVEKYSIDESFVMVPGTISDYRQWGREVRNNIDIKWAIPVSVGVAPSKTLSKLASHRAKEGDGVCVLENDTENVLKETFIGSVWGIGPKLADKFRRNGIKSAYDLTVQDNNWVKKHFGVVGLRIKYELCGISTTEVKDDVNSRKGISSTRSFGKNVYFKDELLQSLLYHLQIATRKLRRQQSVAGSIKIFIRTGKHKVGPQYYGSEDFNLLIPTDDLLTLSTQVKSMLDKVYRPNIPYYRSGVLLSKIQDNELKSQRNLLYEANHHNEVMRLLDMVQVKYGQNSLRLAGVPAKPKWTSKSEYKSYSQSLLDLENLPILGGVEEIIKIIR